MSFIKFFLISLMFFFGITACTQEAKKVYIPFHFSFFAQFENFRYEKIPLTEHKRDLKRTVDYADTIMSVSSNNERIFVTLFCAVGDWIFRCGCSSMCIL